MSPEPLYDDERLAPGLNAEPRGPHVNVIFTAARSETVKFEPHFSVGERVVITDEFVPSCGEAHRILRIENEGNEHTNERAPMLYTLDNGYSYSVVSIDSLDRPRSMYESQLAKLRRERDEAVAALRQVAETVTLCQKLTSESTLDILARLDEDGEPSAFGPIRKRRPAGKAGPVE